MAIISPGDLLTTDEVAGLLKVHPKHVYRLVKQGLPGRRVGREWRFARSDVMSWLESRDPAVRDEGKGGQRSTSGEGVREVRTPAVGVLPSLIAAHGGYAIELLVLEIRRVPENLLGIIPADRGEAMDLLTSGRVLAAGFHGSPELELEGRIPLARIHLVEREVGLVMRRSRHLPDPADLGILGALRLASRPPSAGVRYHLDMALRRQGIDPEVIHAHARSYRSHEEVVFAVVRGEADIGLSVRSWADRLGLEFHPLASEGYSLLVRADVLGDPRVIGLCQAVQGRGYRRALAAIPGHDVGRTGDIRVGCGLMEEAPKAGEGN